MKSLITFTLMVIIVIALALIAYQPHEETSYSKDQVSQLNKLIDQQEPKPVILRRAKETTMLAYLYEDYAADKNPKSLPQDWKGHRR